MVTVTPKGQVLLRHAHPWQERIFAELTADWSDRRREEFRAAMADLIARSYELEEQLAGRAAARPRGSPADAHTGTANQGHTGTANQGAWRVSAAAGGRRGQGGRQGQLDWLTLDMLKSGTRSAGIAVRGK